MSKQPIEALLDTVAWKKRPRPATSVDALPYVTHEGVLIIEDLRLRCYRLSNGQSVFNADDLNAFFYELGEE